ncbi:MAG TPA: hypothetical protein VL598_06520 [Trinickia sp.]|jgi:hypothetical protein|uniref:hypothetical protein n=1 Tax=Trinickia sp. TaxID=2571163 RepID=UPI002C8DFE4F|nr:hypothetical protein [Trinickia sp.]HTI17299.1 hypothetical protein [Trinickia sp.]
MSVSASLSESCISMRRCRRARYSAIVLSAFCALSATLSACGTVDGGPTSAFERRGTYHDAREAGIGWAVLPIVNNTETVSAGQRTAAIAASLLSSLGFKNVQQYPAASDDPLFELIKSDDLGKAKQWAKGIGAKYALTGTVNEWRYKVGIDGEPAIGITLQVIDLESDKVIWSGIASKTGWSREATSALAQRLTKGLLIEVVGSDASRPAS